MFIAKLFSRYPWLKVVLFILVFLKIMVGTSANNLNWLTMKSRESEFLSRPLAWIQGSESMKTFLSKTGQWIDAFGLNDLIAVTAFMIFALIAEAFWRMYTKKRVQKNGIPAKARILEITNSGIKTGGYHNPHNGMLRGGSPVYKILLEVLPENGLPFQAELYEKLSELGPVTFDKDTMIKVKYDPDKPKRIIIDESF